MPERVKEIIFSETYNCNEIQGQREEYYDYLIRAAGCGWLVCLAVDMVCRENPFDLFLQRLALISREVAEHFPVIAPVFNTEAALMVNHVNVAIKEKGAQEAFDSMAIIHLRYLAQWKFGAVFNSRTCGVDLRFADTYVGSRMEVLRNLIQELLGARGDRSDPLVVAEIGVFQARTAYWLLRNLPGISYIGVDPYRYDFQDEKNTSSVINKWSQQGVFAEFDISNDNQSYSDELKAISSGALSKLALFPLRSQLWKMTSREAAALMPDRIVDLVFLDGDHSYAAVKNDIQLWLPKLSDGGILAGHDFGTNTQVTEAVCEYAREYGTMLYLDCDSVWYTKQKT